MPDYDLTGLSSRSFEQLIQAIAVKVIGPKIIIFGDGRDGGREATFEGAIPYPSPTGNWKGYGVVQAKFKQRLQDSKRDGEWALNQLRSELLDFADPEKKRRKPDYYIFATNVVLTPFPEQGSKDSARDIFEEFKDRLQIKDYAIWDYDTIRVFLDGAEVIRKSYAAWITPGDVLSQVMQWFKPDRPDFEETLTSFLQKELLADQYANLEQAGHTSDDRVPIAQVFVDLPSFDSYQVDAPAEEVKDGILPPGFLARVMNSSAEKLDPATLSSASIEGALNEIPRVPSIGRYVLIGGPGQGKTTVGQFICQLFRSAILKERQPDWIIEPEAKDVINTINSQCENEGIPLPSARRFPIRIVLSQFAKALANESGPINSLLSYAVDLIRRKTDQEVSAADFRRWLATYPWTLVLDGLDEVPASSNREAVLGAIRDFRVDARAQNADILIIATTRPQGYNEDFNPTFYNHTWLAPLSTPRAMHYAKRLCDMRYGGDQDRKDKIIQRLTRASNNESTVRLMRSPLQVTIMTTLVDRMGQPPQERWNLFKEYYKVIYQREVERDIPAATILRNYQPDVDMIHNHVGLLLQIESERSGQTDARLSAKHFEIIVENRLREEGHEGKDFADLKRQIIEAATNRLVFLVGLQANEVGFEIRSLQEFMAAEAIMNGGDELIRKRLRSIAPIANWRNVFLFAAGKCFAERQHLRDTIHSICAEMNEDPEDGVVKATLAGSQLALDLLEDGPARRQPKYTQALARVALRLLDLPPTNQHFRLADLYEPGLEEVYRTEIEDRLSNIEPHKRLGAWACLIPLIESKHEWASSVGNQFWPIEPDRQFEIIVVTRDRGGEWWFAKITETTPRISPSEFFTKFYGQRSIAGVNVKTPAWLEALRLMVSFESPGPRFTSTVDVPLPGLTEAHISFTPLNKQDWMIPLKEMPDPTPEWDAIMAAGRFVENPSAASLGEALGKMRQAQYFGLLWNLLPWPLAALSDHQSAVKNKDLAKRAAAGEFGDIDDWIAAQDRWTKKGVSREDIYYTAKHFPFDHDVALNGLPVGGRWTAAYDDLLNLLSLFDEVGNTPLALEVALAILGVGLHSANAESPPLPTIKQLKDLFSQVESGGFGASLSILTRYDQELWVDDEFLDFLNWLGRQKLSLFLTRGGWDYLPLMMDAVTRTPERKGILRILATFLVGYSPNFKLTPDIEREADDVFKESETIVELLRGDWQADRIPVLAKNLSGFIANGTDAYILSLAWDKQQSISVSTADRMFLELRGELESQHWEAHRQINEILNDSLRRRTSNLEDTDVWSALGLPDALREVTRSGTVQ